MIDNNNDLVQARNKYAYPPFSLRRGVSANESDAELWGQSVVMCGPAESDAPKFAGYSSFELDQYHHGLLRSE
ncbi:MAG: hypothetical protein Q8R44_13025, partial [Novosphingobium sp.]|nr:hypothetical protein [Novosphingobium sp.]